MGEATNAVPEVKQSVVPHLIVRGAAKALEFYAEALGATETFRAPTPDGRLMHASMTIGDSWIYLCDEFPEQCDASTGSPQTLGGTPVVLHLNVPDVDASFARAVAAGATRRDAAGRHVLGRAVRPGRRPVRPPLVDVDAAAGRGPVGRGAPAVRRRGPAGGRDGLSPRGRHSGPLPPRGGGLG